MKQLLFEDNNVIISGEYTYIIDIKIMKYTIISKHSVVEDNVKAHFVISENTGERIFITETEYPIYIIMSEYDYDTFHDNIMKYCR
jgi:hypothetical protein